MCLFEKIQKIRCELKEQDIKMTGENKHARYSYFELNDFTPVLNDLMLKHKMTAIPSFTAEVATLTAYDFESKESYSITSPMGNAKLPNCHEVQNIGAVETYQRRYLYQAMFDIAENDALNATQGKEEQKQLKADKEKKEEKIPVRTAKETLKSIIVQNPFEANIIKDIIDTEYGGKPSKELTEDEAKEILNKLSNNPEEQINE